MIWTNFSWMADPKAWIALFTLTFLQVILGVDNIVLLTILSGQLPPDTQKRARKLGLVAAMVSRLILLLVLLYLSSLLQHPFATIFSVAVSGKSLILLVGGIFLIAKATTEISAKMEGEEDEMDIRAAPTLVAVLIQLFVLDVVFSLDSVITAIGMVKIVPIQILAVVIATLFMMFGINSLAEFIDRHPSLKMLALSFLVLIGLNLVAEACGLEIPRGYTYFAMAWSVLVEMVNLRIRHIRKQKNLASLDQAVDPGA
jgi:predicted tellurium resistance membrane protein TerC